MDPNDRQQIQDAVFRSLDEKIGERLEGEREFVKSTIGLAIKIAASAIVISLAIVGWIGVERFGDIKSNIEETAREAIDEYVENSAPQELEKRLGQLYTRSLISFHLHALKTPGVGIPSDYRLTRADAEKLVEIIQNPETDDTTFSGALLVLANAAKQRWWRRIGEKMVLLATADQPEVSLSNRPDRRAQIISALARSGSEWAYRDVRRFIEDSESDPELRVEALHFAEQIGERNEQGILESMAKEQNQSIRLAGLKSLAVQYPNSEVIREFIEELDLSVSDVNELTVAVEVFGSLSNTGGSTAYGTTESLKKATSLAEAILLKLTKKTGLRLQLKGPVMEDGYPALVFLYYREQPRSRLKIIGRISGSSILRRENNPVANLVADLARSQSLDDLVSCLKAVTRRRTRFNHAAWVTARLTQESGVSMEGQTIIGSEVEDSKVRIEYGRRAKPTAIVTWRYKESEEDSHTSEIKGFINPESISFDIESDFLETE